MILDGVYEGVSVEPGTTREVVASMVWSRRERARRAALFMTIAAVNQNKDALKSLVDEYLDMSVPGRKKVSQDMYQEMAHWDQIAQAFDRDLKSQSQE